MNFNLDKRPKVDQNRESEFVKNIKEKLVVSIDFSIDENKEYSLD